MKIICQILFVPCIFALNLPTCVYCVSTVITSSRCQDQDDVTIATVTSHFIIVAINLIIIINY